MAINFEGTMYILYGSNGGNSPFYSVDKTTGVASFIGNTGWPSNYAQSMAFDYYTGTLYWAQLTQAPAITSSFLTIDAETGEATEFQNTTLWPGMFFSEITGLSFVFDAVFDAPLPVTDLTVTPGDLGALNALVSWTNPTHTFIGDPLGAFNVVLYVDDDPVYANANPTAGGSDSFTANLMESGMHTFTVIASNDEGESSPVKTTMWIGHDIPVAPANVVLVNNNLVAELSWTAPTEGIHGAYFSNEGLVYDVYRLNDNELVSEGQTGLTFEENITVVGNYSYKVTARNNVGEGGSTNSNVVAFCMPISSFPLVEDFEDSPSLPVCWSNVYSVPSNGWAIGTYAAYAHSGQRYAVLGWGMIGADYIHMDAWLITPQLEIPEDGVYYFDFWSRGAGAEYYIDGSFKVYISTESNDPFSDDFVVVKSLSATEITESWQKIRIVLEDYVGEKIYIAIRYDGAFRLQWFLDDLEVNELLGLDGAATALYGKTTPMVDEPFVYKVNIKNTGVETLSGYTVKLIDEEDNVLAINEVGPDIEPAENMLINLIYTPTETGAIALRAKFELEEDEIPGNNISPPLNIDVQPWNGTYECIIGTATTSQVIAPNYYNPPWSFNYYYSTAQTVYLDHELINRTGVINEVTYFNNFITDLSEGTTVQLYMANTTIQDFSTGWLLPLEQFTLVFEGEVAFPYGQNEISIPLDIPFVYQGDNLALMTRHPYFEDADYHPYMQVNFYYTEDQIFANRTRNHGGGLEWNPALPGYNIDRNPNIRLSIGLDSGSLSGTVTDGTNPVEGVLIEIIGMSVKQTTDANGEYSFNFIPPGDYQLKASKLGYYDATSPLVTVEMGENTTVPDMVISFIPVFTVSGKVTGNDAPEGLEGVEITLTGYNNYSTTTNSTGDFTITNVYDDITYDVEMFLPGYTIHKGEVTINGADETINVTLIEILYPPVTVIATESGDKSSVSVTWSEAGSTFSTTYQFDDGSAELQRNFTTGYDGYLGGKFPVNEIGFLTSVDIWSLYNAAGGANRFMTIEIFDEDRKSIGVSAPFSFNSPTGWRNIPLDNIPYSGTFYAMLHWPIEGTSNTNYLGLDTNGAYSNSELGWALVGDFWSLMHDFAPGFIAPCFPLIRANANSYGKSVSYGYGSENINDISTISFSSLVNIPANTMSLSAPLSDGYSIIVEEPYNYPSVQNGTTRTLEGYKVFRLQEGAPESEWTPLGEVTELSFTDNDWETVDAGVYRWAVRAKYSGGYLSKAILSNPLDVGMYADVTLTVTPNSGDPVTGAVVKFTNQNGNPEHVYNVPMSTNPATISVWKGIYNLTVTLEGMNLISKPVLKLMTILH